MENVIGILRPLRRRMLLRAFLSRWARATLFFYAVLVVLTTAAWWNGHAFDLSGLPFTLTWPFVFGAIGALLVTALRVPSLREAAMLVDALGGTRDRLLTALLFAEKERATDLELLAVRESAGWSAQRDFRALLPVRPPAELRWLAVPMVMLALLWWQANGEAAAKAAKSAAATEEVRETIRKLEEMAKAAGKKDDEAAKKIAERLKLSASQLRAEAERGGEAHKAALRELSQLEQLVKELRRPQFATPDELKALASALEKHDATKDIAKDIAEGHLADAAKKLNAAANDPAAAEQAQRSVREALDHLARKKEQLSKQLDKLQQENASGERQELLRQLADALSELQQQGAQAQKKPQPNGQQKGEGKQMSDDDLKKLLGALQRMKEQQQSGGEPEGETEEGDGEEGDGPLQMFSFTPSKDGNEQADGPMAPSGKPGGEKDTGTTKDPFGKSPTPAPEAGVEAQTSGKLGEGESLSALVPGAAKGDAKAARRYKELTDAAAAAAEDTVTQEEIPLGARHLIRRYFEALRVKQ